MPGETLRPEHLMRQHSMVSSLDPVVRDSFVKRLTDEEAGKLLLNYWCAARELLAAAPSRTPQEYVIQKPLGAGALHQIFPDVLEVCRSRGRLLAGEDARTRCPYVGRSAGFWHSERGHHMVRQSGAALREGAGGVPARPPARGPRCEGCRRPAGSAGLLASSWPSGVRGVLFLSKAHTPEGQALACLSA